MRAPTASSSPDAPPRVPAKRRRALPWLVVALWVGVLAVLGPLAGGLESASSDSSVEFLPESAESTAVAEIEAERPGGTTTDLILVYQRDGGLTDADRGVIAAQADAISSRYDAEAPPAPVVSDDGTTASYPFSLTEQLDDEEQAAAVAEVRDLAGEDVPDGLQVLLGGPAALDADLGDAFGSLDLTLTLATVLVVTVLLIVIYRSPLLWLVPLIAVGCAAVVARSAVYGMVELFGLTVTAQSTGIMTILIFGAGTDYALLLIARYREELRSHELPFDAMLRAVRRSAPAIAASSGTVAAGLLLLLFAEQRSISGFGPTATVGVLSAVAAMLTLLPALLVLLGRRVFWPSVPAHGSEAGEPRFNLFGRMGGSVAHRPVRVLVSGLGVLAVLAVGIVNLPGPIKQEDVFRNTPESVTALESLAEGFPERSSQPVTVLAPEAEADAVLAAVRSTEGVAEADTGASWQGWTEISVFATDPPESDGEQDTVERLRSDLDAVGDGGALVGGTTAERMDLDAAAARDITVVVPLVLLGVLLILVLLLRALLAPLILLAAVVASWGSALGLGGLVFGPLFGFPGIDPSLLLLTFVFGVALGVDYGIFLMERMREETRRGLDTPQAALVALRRTGGVIASAGIVLASTFAVLLSLPLVFMMQTGFIVAVGVLLDTFLVRTYVVTAASWLLGDRIWWPRRLSRPGDAS